MLQFLLFIIDYYFVISGLLFLIFYSILLYINKNEFKKKNYSIYTPFLSSFVFSFGLTFNVGLFFFVMEEYVLR